jgi:hypothetical protein
MGTGGPTDPQPASPAGLAAAARAGAEVTPPRAPNDGPIRGGRSISGLQRHKATSDGSSSLGQAGAAGNPNPARLAITRMTPSGPITSRPGPGRSGTWTRSPRPSPATRPTPRPARRSSSSATGPTRSRPSPAGGCRWRSCSADDPAPFLVPTLGVGTPVLAVTAARTLAPIRGPARCTSPAGRLRWSPRPAIRSPPTSRTAAPAGAREPTARPMEATGWPTPPVNAVRIA